MNETMFSLVSYRASRRAAILAVCLTVLLLSIAGVAAQTETLTHEERERTYTVHVPASYTGATPVALVIGLHGGGGSAENFAQTSRLSAAADEHGFIVVYPNGVSSGWNDGRRAILQLATRLNIDDVGFLTALIDALEARYNIDRVYMVGISNGGMMTLRFACERAERLAGLMTVVANMPDTVYESCHPSQPVPALMIFGEADPIIPYAGGAIGQGSRRGDIGVVVSAAQTLAAWMNANECAGAGDETALPDLVDDETRVYLTTPENCAAPVAFYRVENGGHGYPGDNLPRLRQALTGILTQDIDATELFVEFFDLS